MKRDEQIKTASKEQGGWHGCATGDCPHDTYQECFESFGIEMAKWADANPSSEVTALEKCLGRIKIGLELSQGLPGKESIWNEKHLDDINITLANFKKSRGGA